MQWRVVSIYRPLFPSLIDSPTGICRLSIPGEGVRRIRIRMGGESHSDCKGTTCSKARNVRASLLPNDSRPKLSMGDVSSARIQLRLHLRDNLIHRPNLPKRDGKAVADLRHVRCSIEPRRLEVGKRTAAEARPLASAAGKRAAGRSLFLVVLGCGNFESLW